MIPSNSITNIYVKIAGQNTLLSMAQSHLLNNIERINKVRTHTFVTNNGQTEFGISKNYGHKRYYSWEDTIIDCRNSPDLVDSEILQNFNEILSENHRFYNFKKNLEERTQGSIEIQPFHSILQGKENMRYNIRCSSKIEDFDIIRVGFCLSAKSDNDFKQGLSNLRDWENPVRFKLH